MDQRQSNTKGRLFASVIAFDWLTYLEKGKEPAQEDKKTYLLKKYRSLTMLRPSCRGPMLDLVILGCHSLP